MWNAGVYGKFEKERMQPSMDLVNRIEQEDCSRILDVGCGSGMSTLPLRRKFPHAAITGVDMSEDMLTKAKSLLTDVVWLQRDCSKPLTDLGLFSVVFSNAFLQWLPDQEGFIKNARELLQDDGVLAMQIPGFEQMEVCQMIKETAKEFDAANRLFAEIGNTNCFNYDAAQYYGMFSSYFSYLDLWQTAYIHQMEDSFSIIEFLQGSALLPYLACLKESEKPTFIKLLHKKINTYYKASINGTVLFPFQRIFVMARKN